MSASRRPVSRRGSSGSSGSAARGAAATGTIDGPIDGPIDDPELTESMDDADQLSDADIRRARAEERRVLPEETVERSVVGERLGGLRQKFDDTRAELKKITWPDRETTRNLTIVVIGISVVLGILLGGIDFVLFQLFEAMT